MEMIQRKTPIDEIDAVFWISPNDWATPLLST